MRFTRLVILLAVASACAACGRDANAPQESAARALNIYSWADYIAPDAIAGFEKETGVRIVHDTYDNTEILETKLLTGRTGYDVVMVGGVALRVVGLGVFQPLDRTLLPHWGNQDAALMAKLAPLDPGNRHVAGYLWATSGIGYDAARVSELAPNAPTDSWRMVFDPAVISKLAPCGFVLVDSRTEVIGSALAYLGRDPNSESPQDLQAVEDLLVGIRPSVRKIETDSQIGDLVAGEICVAVAPATIVMVARARAAEAGIDRDLRFFIPKEGTVSLYDGFAIPADAANARDAHAFIDYMMRPEVAAANANFGGSATMNRAAVPFLDESMRNDPAIYPPPEVIARLTMLLPDSQQQSRAETRVWTRFKTGQ